MRIVNYRYSALNLDHVWLDTGESFTSAAEHSARVYGVFMLQGLVFVTDPTGKIMPQRQIPTGQYSPPINPDRASSMTAEQPSEWLCLSARTTLDLNISQLDVTDTETLEPGCGFIVATGSIEAEGLTISGDGYFRPRAQPVILTGTAHLLLIHPDTF